MILFKQKPTSVLYDRFDRCDNSQLLFNTLILFSSTLLSIRHKPSPINSFHFFTQETFQADFSIS